MLIKHIMKLEKIRKTIEELGSTLPEDLLTSNKSLKELEKENRKLEDKF